MYVFVIQAKIYIRIEEYGKIMQATVKVARAGQVVIPTVVREAMDIKPGDIIIIDILGKAPKAIEQGNADAQSLPVHA